MNLSTEGLAALLSAISAIIAAILAFLSSRQVQKTFKVSTYNQISNAYDKVISYRLEHPEVLSLSRKWNSNLFNLIYGDVTDESKKWVKYYTFVELCIGYCNLVLHARERKLLSEDAFDNQHEPLLKLFLTEHNTIIQDLVDEQKYISIFIQNYRKEQQEKGWNWETEYEQLTTVPKPTPPQKNSLKLKF